MADSVTSWIKGNVPTPGTPSTGYDYMHFNWNLTSGTSHAALISDAFSMHNDEWTIQLNTGAIALANNMGITLLGSNNPDLDTAKWSKVIDVTVTNSGITDQVFDLHVCHTGTASANTRFNHYRIKLDPSADPGSDKRLKVNLVPGKFA